MTYMVSGTAQTLSAGLMREMAQYRYRVFVEMLEWDLRTQAGMELDEFDRKDTVYVAAHKEGTGLQGIARLLPTDKPYLLGDVFPQLLGGHAAPRSACVWELSRFAAIDPESRVRESPSFGASAEALALLDRVMAVASEAGACDLVTVSPLGIERLLERAGIVAHRVAPPLRVAGHALFACRIELAASIKRRASRPSSL